MASKQVKPLCDKCGDAPKSTYSKKVSHKPVASSVCHEVAQEVEETECCSTGVMMVCTEEPDVAHQEPVCVENHCPEPTVVVASKHWVKTLESFNWPNCLATATIKVDDADGLIVGQQLVNVDVGYLTVRTIINSNTIEVRNECIDASGSDCNKFQPGDPVLSCTKFGVGFPPCVEQIETYLTQTGTHLVSDYLIPEVGDCVDIKITTVDGLTKNDTISISGYEYRIGKIISANAIRICNDGAGGPVGVLIEDDADGDNLYDHLIVRIGGEDPCISDPVNEGLPIVCKDGKQAPMVGQVDNQVSVWNQARGIWELQQFPESQDCVALTDTLTLDPSAETFIACVTDNTICEDQSPSIVTVGGHSFTVQERIGTDKLRLFTPLGSLPDIKKLPEGTPLCCADCCSPCRQAFSTVTASPLILDNGVDIGAGVAGVPIPIGCSDTLNLENTGCQNMVYKYESAPLLQFAIADGGAYAIESIITTDGVASGPIRSFTYGATGASLQIPGEQKITFYDFIPAYTTKSVSVCYQIVPITPAVGSQVGFAGGTHGFIAGTS